MYLSYSLVLSLLLTFQLLSAQQQAGYTYQQDDSLLKKKYLNQSLHKKSVLLSTVEKQYAKDFKTIYGIQFDEIAGLWNSGRPVTAPGPHDYLQQLVKKITSANAELRSTDARVVFSRDWWPNAYSMGDGSIVINAGLLIYLQNEAELAFVISHELAHYHLDHSGKGIRSYIQLVNSDTYQAELKRIAKSEYRVNEQLQQFARPYLFDSRKHSRRHEAEADQTAFRYMQQSGFDTRAILSCLQLLDNVDDSSLYQSAQPAQVFDLPGYPFKARWTNKQSAIFSQVSGNDIGTGDEDSLKTHPACQERIELLKDSIKPGGELFPLDESKFISLKRDFYLEMCEHAYRSNQISRNLYYSILLMQSPENRQVAIYSIARCLNTLYEKQKDHKLGLAIDSEKKGYPEDYNILLRMLNRLRLEELASISRAFCRQHAAAMAGYPGFAEEFKKAEQK